MSISRLTQTGNQCVMSPFYRSLYLRISIPKCRNEFEVGRSLLAVQSLLRDPKHSVDELKSIVKKLLDDLKKSDADMTS